MCSVISSVFLHNEHLVSLLSFYSCKSLTTLQSYFNYILYCVTITLLQVFLPLSLILYYCPLVIAFVISCFVISSIDYSTSYFFFTCFFHLDLLMISTFFIFSSFSCAIRKVSYSLSLTLISSFPTCS